jgi:hypothetical protein
MIRIRADIFYALTETMSDGRCALPLTDPVKLSAALLDAPIDLIHIALDLELREGTAIADTIQGAPYIFLAALHRAEQMISARLLTISHDPLP